MHAGEGKAALQHTCTTDYHAARVIPCVGGASPPVMQAPIAAVCIICRLDRITRSRLARAAAVCDRSTANRLLAEATAMVEAASGGAFAGSCQQGVDMPCCSAVAVAAAAGLNLPVLEGHAAWTLGPPVRVQ